MKKSIFTLVLLVCATLFTNESYAQEFSKLDVSPMDAAVFPGNYRDSEKRVRIVYSRPKLKGRSLEKLAPKDKVWRTGANEASEITFYKDAIFGGKEVKAGTYTLFTIPGDNEWTVILNSTLNVWGAYFYKESEDVVRVTATVSKSNKSVEAFSIVFEGEDNKATMFLGWGTTVVSVPVSFEKTSE